MQLTGDKARRIGIAMTPFQDERGRGFHLTPTTTHSAEFLRWMHSHDYIYWLHGTGFQAVYRTR